MKIRTRLGVVCAVAVTLSPALAQAATERAALEACVRAMATDIGEVQGAPVAFQIDGKSDNSRRRLDESTVFYLDAADAKSGEIVARVDCRVGRDAVVQELTTLPLSARDARSRRRG